MALLGYNQGHSEAHYYCCCRGRLEFAFPPGGVAHMSSRLYAAPFSSSSASMDIETTIRNLTQDFCMAFNTGNYDQAAALFAPDGVFMSANHPPVQSNKLIERALQQLAENGYQDLRLETVRVEYSGDLAMELGR